MGAIYNRHLKRGEDHSSAAEKRSKENEEMSEPLSDKSRIKHVVKHLPSRWNKTTELVVSKILAEQFSEIRADEAERCASLLDYWARYDMPLCRNLAAAIRAHHARGAALAAENDKDINGAL